jgi:hypothetical protein
MTTSQPLPLTRKTRLQKPVASSLAVIGTKLLRQASDQRHTNLVMYLQLLVLTYYVLTIPSLSD